VKVKDDISGVDSYSAEINGKWILMEYDPKNDQLNIPLTDSIPMGKFDLIITVKDKCGNENRTIYQMLR
jgi:hypothetical protein